MFLFRLLTIDAESVNFCLTPNIVERYSENTIYGGSGSIFNTSRLCSFRVMDRRKSPPEASVCGPVSYKKVGA